LTSPGHAFVLIGRALPDGSTYFYAVGGFYPDESRLEGNEKTQNRRVWITGTPGTVAYDIDDTSCDVSFRADITPDQERRALFVLRNWEGRSYALTWQSCTDLVKTIARTVGLRVPNLGPNSLWPEDLVQRLREMNGAATGLQNGRADERRAEADAARSAREQQARRTQQIRRQGEVARAATARGMWQGPLPSSPMSPAPSSAGTDGSGHGDGGRGGPNVILRTTVP
jgi:hypothetical protein